MAKRTVVTALDHGRTDMSPVPAALHSTIAAHTFENSSRNCAKTVLAQR